MEDDRKQIVDFLTNWVRSAISAKGGQAGQDIPENYDLVEAGLIDSLGFVRLIEEIEREFNIEIDLSDADPEQLTSISGLADAAAPVLLQARNA